MAFKSRVLLLYAMVFAVNKSLSFHYLKRSEVGTRGAFENYEIIFLPAVLPKREAISEDGEEIDVTLLEFEAFGRSIAMDLRENNKLTSSDFKAFIHNGNNSTLLPTSDEPCLLLHKNQGIVASINNCNPEFITGFVFLDDATFEINPAENLLESDAEGNVPHIVKKIPHTVRNDFVGDEQEGKFTLEVAVFFDEPAYKVFAPFLSYNDEKLRDLLLAYLNGVQALYHHPTLGGAVEIVVVRMDILKAQPETLPTFKGESGPLLDSFCSYQKELNVEDDSEANHWDAGLYISGLDFFTYDGKGRRDYGTMGLSTVGGVCHARYSCVIAEFGSTDVFGRPYPTAGFTSVYVLAHEIGHSLGMHHDGTKNDCPADGFIMSASRGAAGETRWSRCSAAIMKELHKKKCLQDDGASRYDHSGFVGAPGRVYTAKRQCEVFLTDRDAHVVEDPGDVCANLKCKTPRRPGYYFAGPALDGTQCGGEKQCHAGDCIKSSNVNSRTVPDVWGRWKDDGRCKSGCIVKSRGFQTKRRKCSDAEENCYGPSSTKVLCKDTDICQQRISAIDYASERCKVFSGIFPNFDSKGIGLQSPHEKDRPWLGCAIFCRKRDGTYYAPVTELNDLEISSHFPDGTWCHRQNSENYYCLNHQCISENSKLLRTSSKDDIIQNAIPGGNIPDELVPYFSLDKNGEPFHLDFLRKRPKDEEWALDYILLPDS